MAQDEFGGVLIDEPQTNQFETPLTTSEEEQFQAWKKQYAPRDSGVDYDLRGAFKAGLKPGSNGHWPDTYKKPNHPTFSDESIYAKDRPELAGHWKGETFIPPQRDEFGGVAVEEAPATPVRQIRPPPLAQTAMMMGGGATALGAPVPPGMGPLREFGRTIAKPIINLAPTPGEIVEGARQSAPIGVDYRKIAPPMTEEQVQKRMKESPAAAAVIGAGQALGDIDSFFTSPLGIATLATAGLGAIPAGVQRAVALGFSAQMASQTPELARQLGEELGKPEKDRDYAKIARLTVNGLANTGFTVAGARSALAPRRVVTPPPAPAPRPETAPVTPSESAPAKPSAAPAQVVKIDELISRPAGAVDPTTLANLSDADTEAYFNGRRKNEIATQRDGVLAGMKLKEADVEQLRFYALQAQRKAMEAIKTNDNTAFLSNSGKVVWLNGAIEGALRKGPNYDLVSRSLPPEATPATPQAPPAPAAGTVRLYQGSGGAEGAGQGGAWFTTNPERAASFGPNIQFVDVPQEVADAAAGAAQGAGSGTAGDHMLPADWVKQAKPLPGGVPQKVFETDIISKPPTITAAAYLPKGATAPETGPNHPAILARLGVKGFETPESRNTPEFGYVLSDGRFITREEAGPISKASGQNLVDFEPGEPVHSNEVASPTEPEKPLSEAAPIAPEELSFSAFNKNLDAVLDEQGIPRNSWTPEDRRKVFEGVKAVGVSEREVDRILKEVKELERMGLEPKIPPGALDRLRKKVAETLGKPKGVPTAPAPAAEPEWMGKPLSYWEQLANKLPTGSDRATLARSLGVANQPAKIKRQILRRVEEIRRQPPAASPVPEPTVAPTVAPVLFVKYRNRLRQVSPERASSMMDEIRRKTGLGYSQLGQLKLYDANGGEIGHVSYNGNVWVGDELAHNATGLVKTPEGKWDVPKPAYWKELTEVQDKLMQIRQRARSQDDTDLAIKNPEFARLILERNRILGLGAGEPAQLDISATATPVAPEVAPAAAKAQAEVSKVAATEGQRPAKEVKSELVARLEDAIKTAKSERNSNEIAGDFLELQQGPPDKSKMNFNAYTNRKADYDRTLKRLEETVGKVTIEIPGDGTFTVWNTKENLSRLLERAKGISTKSGEPVKVSRTGVSKQDKEWIAAQLAAQPPTPAATEPAPIGMGAAALGEVQPTGPRGEPVHGIAARVSEAAAGQGIIAPVEPGEGIAAAESVSRGRELLAQGADPQAVLDEFNRTKAVTADGMAVVRAHGERLRKAAYAAADQFGVLSEQYEKAWEADSDWTKAIKPLQTEWHKIGQAQQGEVEIDTGTFHGLRMAHIEATGKDFTPDQAKTAKEIAEGVQKATKEADKAKDDVLKTVAQQAPQAPATPPVTAAKPSPGAPAATPTTAKAKPGIARPSTVTVWDRARAIIDGGETDFDNLRHKLAIEFGLPVDEITKILAEPKAARALTDEMYRKMSERRRLTTAAKNWLKDQELPRWRQFIRNVPRIFFIDKVFGHGTVGMITHAGLNIFNPSAWATYWPNFLRQYRLLASGAYHERMMQDLVRDPLFTKARRAGLANDPFRYQDDYQTPGMAKWLGRLGLAGNRGFDSLKLFRQARFNQIWNSLDPKLQTKEYASIVADAVNHATGVVRTSFGGEWANWTFFAPKLEGSRWAWMIGDPFKAATTFVDWRGASPEARAFAMAELKQKAAVAGTYLSLLAINQGILSASGSDEKINYTNPRRSDFLSFKAAGHNIGIVGPMLGMVRLFANLLHASMGKRGKLESLQSRADEFGSLASQYARGKLSPFAGFGVDLASQADFQGRPLPFSKDVVPKYLRQQGIDRYTYGEYAAQEFTPIPVSEAVREVWRDQGMHDNQIQTYLDALLVGAVAGGTGARISVEQPQRKTQPQPQ